MGSVEDLIRDIRAYEDRKALTNALARQVRKPVPAVRRKIRARALDTLPSAGGFGAWVSRLSVTARVKLQGRNAGIRLVGRLSGFKDQQPKVDLRRIDDGRARHPSWGRRAPDQWHVQAVKPDFFWQPASETDQWRRVALDAVDEALEVIRGRG